MFSFNQSQANMSAIYLPLTFKVWVHGSNVMFYQIRREIIETNGISNARPVKLLVTNASVD